MRPSSGRDGELHARGVTSERRRTFYRGRVKGAGGTLTSLWTHGECRAMDLPTQWGNRSFNSCAARVGSGCGNWACVGHIPQEHSGRFWTSLDGRTATQGFSQNRFGQFRTRLDDPRESCKSSIPGSSPGGASQLAQRLWPPRRVPRGRFRARILLECCLTPIRASWSGGRVHHVPYRALRIAGTRRWWRRSSPNVGGVRAAGR